MQAKKGEKLKTGQVTEVGAMKLMKKYNKDELIDFLLQFDKGLRDKVEDEMQAYIHSLPEQRIKEEAPVEEKAVKEKK